jgi:NAD(P)H-hydrate epimerase
VGKTGAAHLSGLAALRSGAGLVTIATPAPALPVVAAMAPEYMTVGLPDLVTRQDGEAALERVLEMEADVVAAGPGLGLGEAQVALVMGLVARSGSPLVLDADALTILAGDVGVLREREGLDIVLTPHPGEMARLAGLSTEDVQRQRVDVAREFATTHRVYLVLKGHRTLIAAPDGRVAINRTGNPGMATGGTGDVLTGVIAAWLAQLLDPDAAARVGVYLHGLAGDLASRSVGQPAVTAGDVLRHLGPAWLETLGISRQGQEEDG